MTVYGEVSCRDENQLVRIVVRLPRISLRLAREPLPRPFDHVLLPSLLLSLIDLLLLFDIFHQFGVLLALIN